MLSLPLRCWISDLDSGEGEVASTGPGDQPHRLFVAGDDDGVVSSLKQGSDF